MNDGQDCGFFDSSVWTSEGGADAVWKKSRSGAAGLSLRKMEGVKERGKWAVEQQRIQTQSIINIEDCEVVQKEHVFSAFILKSTPSNNAISLCT